MSWQWYQWDNQETFDAWHNDIKAKLGLPRLSIDREGNEIEPMITNYTLGVSVNGKVIAMVEEENAKGLALTDLRPPKPKIEI